MVWSVPKATTTNGEVSWRRTHTQEERERERDTGSLLFSVIQCWATWFIWTDNPVDKHGKSYSKSFLFYSIYSLGEEADIVKDVSIIKPGYILYVYGKRVVFYKAVMIYFVKWHQTWGQTRSPGQTQWKYKLFQDELLLLTSCGSLSVFMGIVAEVRSKQGKSGCMHFTILQSLRTFHTCPDSSLPWLFPGNLCLSKKSPRWLFTNFNSTNLELNSINVSWISNWKYIADKTW